MFSFSKRLFMSTVAFSVWAASGCEDDGAREPALPDVPVVHRTQHATVAISEDNPHRICGGTLARIDRHVEAVSKILDVEPEPIEIYWYEEAPNTSSPSAYFAFAAIVATETSLLHELVHAITIPVLGASLYYSREDIANAYEVGPTLLKDTLVSSENLGKEIHGSGHFSRWLIETRGPVPFRAFFGRSATSADDLRGHLEDAYGMSLEALEAEFFRTAPAWYSEVGACDGLERILWPEDENRFSYEALTDCDSPSAFGHTGNEGAPYTKAFVLELPEELVGRDFISPETPGWLTPCDIGEGPPGEQLTPGENGDVEPLFEGPVYEGLGYPLGTSFVNEFKRRLYRVEVPFSEDGEIASVALELLAAC